MGVVDMISEMQEPDGNEGDGKPQADKDFGMVKCPNCEQMFFKKRAWQVFCSTPCRMKAHQLERESAVREYRMMKRSRGVEDAK